MEISEVNGLDEIVERAERDLVAAVEHRWADATRSGEPDREEVFAILSDAVVGLRSASVRGGAELSNDYLTRVLRRWDQMLSERGLMPARDPDRFGAGIVLDPDRQGGRGGREPWHGPPPD